MGLRREISLLLPVAMLVVIGIGVFNLFAYRSALTLLAEERRDEAERLARAAAAAWSETSAARLRALAPQASGLAVLDADGTVLTQVGEVETSPLPDSLGGGARSAARGLSAALPDRVSGYARLPGEPARYLRIDLPATVLAAQRRGLRVLFPVALVAGAAALVLVVLFGRHAFAPYDALLERARAAGAVGESSDDEVISLVATFERALAALARPASSPEDDIAALERALAPSLESGLLLLDRDGGVIALNPTGAAILDVTPPAPGTPLAAALATVPQVSAALAPALAGTSPSSRREIEFLRRGEPRSLGFTLHALRRDDGSVRGHLALFADLTEARRKEEESRVADGLAHLGELTAGLAHELRNSLATLRGYLTLIERHPEEERIADYLAEIRRETDQLQRVLEDFLSFARPGSVRLEEISLDAVVRRAASDPALRGAPVEIVEESPPLPRALADPQLLERAVRNLLHNAVEAQEATAAPDPIVARLRATPGGIELNIEDRGPGIAAEMRERLFHPFATARPGGVGLGLALSHRIVTLHGGTLRLEDREGGGTRAVLQLPAATA